MLDKIKSASDMYGRAFATHANFRSVIRSANNICACLRSYSTIKISVWNLKRVVGAVRMCRKQYERVKSLQVSVSEHVCCAW